LFESIILQQFLISTGCVT